MAPIVSNQLVRASYARAVAFVKRSDSRRLTQREYLDTTFGVNPRTGKRYNERTLRKWLKGERKADKPVERAQRGGGTFNVAFVAPSGEVYSVNINNTFGSSRLDIYTPRKQADFRRTAKKALAERYIAPSGVPNVPLTETPKAKLRTTRTLKQVGIKPVARGKRSVILRRSGVASLNYVKRDG